MGAACRLRIARCTFASGVGMGLLGRISLEVRLGHQVCTQEFYISSVLCHEYIAGTDLLEKLGLNVQPRQRCATVEGSGERIPFLGQEPNHPRFTPVAATLVSAVTIGPLAEMLVPVATPSTDPTNRPSGECSVGLWLSTGPGYGRYSSDCERPFSSSNRFLLTFMEPWGQMARWLAQLQEYNLQIEYQAGRTHANADALSRQPAVCAETGAEEACRCFTGGRCRQATALQEHAETNPPPMRESAVCATETPAGGARDPVDHPVVIEPTPRGPMGRSAPPDRSKRTSAVRSQASTTSS
ncbi:uncharacterized protein LOC142930564 [Petromyzon marinus]|uniref:uncharacterized protein LOC142930564 n=1 Tax=Petromyzon marinus TaxID=7757 RepID=UPI003F71CAC5